jgi:hypothetical protein
MNLADLLKIQTFLDIHEEKGPEAAIAWARQEEAKLAPPVKLVPAPSSQSQEV